MDRTEGLQTTRGHQQPIIEEYNHHGDNDGEEDEEEEEDTDTDQG